MDWLIDTAAPDAAGHTTELLIDHLVRHADDEADAAAARDRIRDEVARAVTACDGRPLHLHLDWTAGPGALTCSAVDAEARLAGFGAVPAADRADVRALTRDVVGRLELPVERRGMRTYDSGPPPVVAPDIDPAVQGAAAVAVALTAAMEAHPTATPPQTAAIAGSILAGAVERDPADAAAVGEEFVRLHTELGSDAHVVAVRDDVVELAVTRCPFGVAGGGSSLCHLSSGLAGQLGARVDGSAVVVLDESIADGDPECHLQVRLGSADVDRAAQPHFWPPHAVANTQTVPNLDLSVSLPRESVSVPVVRRLAAQALRAFGVYDEDVDDVQLAITEACANVIDHAAETDTYEVKIELAADRCALTIVDQGSGFNAAGVPEQAEHDAEMGRGLTLMRALVDNVAFRNEPQAGAVVHMVKTLRYDVSHPLRRVGR